MAPLRVATVITRFNGGAGLVALNGGLALDAGEYEQTVVTGGTGMDGKAAESGAAEPVLYDDAAVAAAATGDLTPQAYKAGMKVTQVRSLVPQISPRDDLAALRTLTELLAAGRYDVVHTHSAKAGVIGRIAAARAGVPRIVHTWHGFPFNEFQSVPRRQAYIALERRAARHTDAFLAIGTQTATTAVRLGLTTPERVRVCWPAIDLDGCARGNSARAQARRLLDLPLGAKVVGSFGRVGYGKGTEIFVKAIARLPEDAFGVWVGAGPTEPKMRQLSRRLGLADRMRWLGHRDDATELLPAFDVLAMATRYEGLPCTLVEAAAAGVPMVATTVGSIPDLVLPGLTGLLVAPEEPGRLADAVAYLLDHPAQARRMTLAARAHVGDWYTPRYLGTVLDETYRGDSRRPTR